jgi:hypothetical protein
MTVNERLYRSGLLRELDEAVATKDQKAVRTILEQIYLRENVEAIIRNESK